MGAPERSSEVWSFPRTQAKLENPGKPLPTDDGKLARFLPYFDWRLAGVVPRVRNQQNCNACWAFTAVAAFESAIMKNSQEYKPEVRELSDGVKMIQAVLSVQTVLDCVSEGNCDGGWYGTAFAHFIDNGSPVKPLESFEVADRDFIGKKGRCTESERVGIQAVAWDFVADRPERIPSIKKLKESLLKHGPLAICITRDERLNKYKGGVFTERIGPRERRSRMPNHAVLLTGWDDKKRAWIIQNSFGEDWGSSCVSRKSLKISPVVGKLLKDRGGCMFIRWGSNNVGKFAAWIEAPIFEMKPVTWPEGQNP